MNYRDAGNKYLCGWEIALRKLVHFIRKSATILCVYVCVHGVGCGGGGEAFLLLHVGQQPDYLLTFSSSTCLH